MPEPPRRGPAGLSLMLLAKKDPCSRPCVQPALGVRWGRGGPSAVPSALQKMVESQRQNVLAEFGRLRRLLAEEEQRLLQRLEEEELEVLPPLRDSAARLGQQSARLAELIAELEGRCQLPALGLLQVSRVALPGWVLGALGGAGVTRL